MSIKDTDLQLRTDWHKNTGANISGNNHPVIPDVYGFDQSFPPGMRLYTQGKAYADWLAGVNRPILPNTGHLKLKFKLTADVNVQSTAQALEFDTRVAIAGWDHNFSSQIVVSGGNKFQISDANGSWVDSGWIAPPLIPGTPCQFEYNYFFDVVKHIYSFISAAIGGTKYDIPGKLQNLPAKHLGWADGAYLQVQLDVNAKGGAYAEIITDVQYEWS